MCETLTGHFFALLEEKEQENLLAAAEIKCASKEAVLFDLNDPAAFIYFLLDGLVFIEKECKESEEQLIKHIIKSNEVFGEQVLWSTPFHQDKAIVKSAKCRFLKIPVDDFQCVLNKNEPFSQFFMNGLFKRLEQLEARYIALNHKSTKYRLKHLLLSMIPTDQTNKKSEVTLQHCLSLKEMGNMVRASAQTMSSILNDWKGKRILDYRKECVIIEDYERFVGI